MKRCSNCKREQPLAEFGRCSRARDGRQSWCRSCKAALARETYQHDPVAARARSSRRMAARRTADPAGEAAKLAAWKQANPERVAEHERRKRATPARQEWQAAYWREWKRRHPDRVREIARRGQLARRARLAQVHIEDVDPLVLFERDHGLCGICREPVDRDRFDVEHIVPLSRGGEHSYANTQVAHPSCNYRKGTKMYGDRFRIDAGAREAVLA